jgi:hypothetical protein
MGFVGFELERGCGRAVKRSMFDQLWRSAKGEIEGLEQPLEGQFDPEGNEKRE